MATALNLAANIAQLRKGMGITQDELATHLGVTKASVSKWETGQSFPDIALLPQIANYFGVSIDSLMGYAPQISRQMLEREAQRLRKLFASESFGAAHDACHAFAHEYYACPRALTEVATIYLNHLAMAPDEIERTALLDEAIELCRRTRALDATVSELRFATAVEAAAHLALARPDEAVALLDSSQVIEYGEAQLLASAYAMLGSPAKSEQVLQATTFQSQILALNALCQMANSPASDLERVCGLHRRALAIVDAFDLDADYVNAAAFHLSFASAYASRGDADSAIECLERYARVAERLEFPLVLYSGSFFDQLSAWMEEQDVSSSIPREDDLLKASLLTGVTQNPAFAALAKDARFKRIAKALEAKFA